MGCFCSKSEHGSMMKKILNDPTVVNAEKTDDQPEFVNDDTTQKDNDPLLNSSSANTKTIAVQESSSSSSVDQNMIQKLLAEVDDEESN